MSGGGEVHDRPGGDGVERGDGNGEVGTSEGAAGPTQGVAVASALLWAVTLAWLGVLWVNSPFSGQAPLFGLWSLTALPLAAWTLGWLRKAGVGLSPPGGWIGVLVALWTAAGLVAILDPGTEMALDGLVLRQPLRRWMGRVLQWLPAAFGGVVTLTGMVISFEARSRIGRKH